MGIITLSSHLPRGNFNVASRYDLTFTANWIHELRVSVTKIQIDHHWNRGINIFRKDDIANHVVSRPRFALKTPNQNCFYLTKERLLHQRLHVALKRFGN